MRRSARASHREPPRTARLDAAVAGACRVLAGPDDLDALIARIGDARFVLLGEASHGTAEYYAWRTAITLRLVRERGFSFVAVEGDWPDCARVDRYVRGEADAGLDARDVLRAFQRWPTWMWANQEVADLVEALRTHNDGRRAEEKAGFYGLDVYSLWDSLYAVLAYLQRARPDALPAARRAFRCFEPYAEDVQQYARASQLVPDSCAQEVVELLAALRSRPSPRAGPARDDRFEAEQNAHVLKSAEAYYRAMVRGGSESWNVRDRHMADTLQRLVDRHGPRAKAVVWEHNTHVGDARFTDMAGDGLVNVGQLVRETHGLSDVAIVGFASYEGAVIAGSEWDAPAEEMTLPPARERSWEDLLHAACDGDTRARLFVPPCSQDMLEPRGHRAIGVVYRPELEHVGNYVPTVLPLRYDALVFLDRTHALHPLGVPADDAGEVPQTYPSGA